MAEELKNHSELVDELVQTAQNATGTEKVVLDAIVEQHFASVRTVRSALGLDRDTGIVLSPNVTEK